MLLLYKLFIYSIMAHKLKQKTLKDQSTGFEPDVNRTRNLLIWSQTRYHCATDP